MDAATALEPELFTLFLATHAVLIPLAAAAGARDASSPIPASDWRRLEVDIESTLDITLAHGPAQDDGRWDGYAPQLDAQLRYLFDGELPREDVRLAPVSASTAAMLVGILRTAPYDRIVGALD